MVWRGWTSQGDAAKRKLTLRKRYFFVIEKYVEDVKQDEKSVPDLLEAIMKAPGLVKEELRRKTTKMMESRPNITKIKVSTVWMSGKSTDSRRRPMPAFSLVSFKQ